MVKKFKIIQNLERKYNGENLPIVVRQDDVGTVIESQIFTEENNPYDLTGCNVTFSMQAASGWPVLDEKVEIIDAVNGKISYSLSAKDTKISGRTKAACFSIHKQDGSILESTGDIDLIILAIPKIKDSDLVPTTTNLKNKIKGDRKSNPNWAGAGSFVNFMVDPDNPSSGRIRFTTYPELFYELNQGNGTEEPLKGLVNYESFNMDKDAEAYKWNQDPNDRVGLEYTNMLFYIFSIKSNTIKIRINNLFPYKIILKDNTGNEYWETPTKAPQMYNDNGSLDFEAPYTHGYKDHIMDINQELESKLNGFTPLQETNLPIKQTDGTYKDTPYVSSFELDLRKNHFLTKNNELLIFMPYYFRGKVEDKPQDFYAVLHPNIECVQYSLPENPD